jgi:para-aminobenzoate synthetase/4-amino-4-deoxychorismate lyase
MNVGHGPLAPRAIEGAIPSRARLVSVPLDGTASPLDVAARLRRRPRAAFLHGAWFGGGAILASDPAAWVSGSGAGALAVLDEQPEVDAADAPEGALGGGFLGGFGYGAAESAPVALAFHDHLLRHDGRQWAFEMLWTPGRAAELDAALQRGRRLVGPPDDGETDCGRARLVDVVPPERAPHVAAVQAAQARIGRGAIYQANICTELTARLQGEPFALWRQLVKALDPAYAAFVPTPEGVAVGASPELFLRRSGDEASTEPIKGTRPRSGDPAHDAALRKELAGSAKDRAENVMIVDLMRNDLGRVARIGSVAVESLLEVRAGAGVWHLVSRVRAQLRDGIGDARLLEATLPPGSVTGAPKIAAMQAIAGLERAQRRLYTGAVGMLTPTRGLELAVVIRTFEIEGDRVRLGVGGGITEGSDPEAEYQECLVKAAPLLRAAR